MVALRVSVGYCLNYYNPSYWFEAQLCGSYWGLITPFIYQIFITPEIVIKSSPIGLIIAGLLVGFGTRLGSGCTSGHGILGSVAHLYAP